MSDDQTKPDSLYDVRVAKRNLARGLITKAELDARREATEDCAELAEEATVQFVHSNRDDEEASEG